MDGTQDWWRRKTVAHLVWETRGAEHLRIAMANYAVNASELQPKTEYLRLPAAFSIAVRAGAARAGIGKATATSVASLDSQIALGDVRAMRDELASYLKYPRFRAAALAALSGLALLLAAIGLYGVLAQFVAQRTREIGVRMAVGAARADILKWIARHAGSAVLGGMAAGLGLSFAFTRFLGSLLFGVTPQDLITFAAVAALMLAAATLGMALPARRATAVDPLVALRDD